MALIGKFTPALSRRAFFVLSALCSASLLIGAPASRPPDLAQVGKPSPEEAARLIEQVRDAGIPGEFYLQFELRGLPRRGEGPTFKGQLWSGHNDRGIITRVEITDAGGVVHRLLIQRGERPAAWRVENGRAVTLDDAALLAPLIPGVEVSAFDLQMPFLYWADADVEKVTRVLGRPAHAFVFRPPAAFAAKHPDVTGVRAYLDGQYNAILQTEILGRNGVPAKTYTFVSIKKVGDQPLPKQADYRNESTRDKTRVQITGAALNLKLSPAIFQPEKLAEPVSPPAANQIVRLDP